MTVEVGQAAPDFKLKGLGGQFVTLSEYRGKKNVVLVFFPLAFSPVCSHQLPAIQGKLVEFQRRDAEILGISVDSHYANEAFARHLGLAFALLSDFKHEAAERYGVLRADAPISERAVFVVDKQGIVRFKQVSPNPGDLAQVPQNEAILRVLSALS
jgi:peroxiredoxin (alkyl hydroperoxide reductase subunit C)